MPVNSASPPLARPPSAAAASARRIIRPSCFLPLDQRRARLLFVGKMRAPAGDLLVVLVPLAGDEDDIAFLRLENHLLDGTGAIRFGVATGRASAHGFDDRERIFA